MIAIATGTRADWGLLRPLAVELDRRGVEIEIWATNTHANPDFGNTAEEIRFDGFEPRMIGRYVEGAEETVAENVVAFGREFREKRPEMVVILGDRMEMLGVASATLLAGIPIAHIAGGTVSEGAVDDAIRNAISQMASLHLTETPGTRRRLLAMGIADGRIVVTGALGVYNGLNRRLMTREELERDLGMDFGNRLLVGTLHAATHPGPGETPLEAMRAFTGAVGKWLDSAEGGRVVLTWPNNDVDPTPQIAELEELEKNYKERVRVVPSLGALRYLSLVAVSNGVIGNSSSALVEVPSMGVPSLDIGSRQRGRECEVSVIHCGPSQQEIFEGILKILSEERRQIAAKRENPYFRPDTPSLMASAIIQSMGESRSIDLSSAIG